MSQDRPILAAGEEFSLQHCPVRNLGDLIKFQSRDKAEVRQHQDLVLPVYTLVEEDVELVV